MSYNRRRNGTGVVLQADWKRFIKYLKETVPELSHIHDNTLPFLFYSRRVDMEYIIPEMGELEDDSLVKEEGLYPATIIPNSDKDGRMLAIRIKEQIRPREFEGPSRLDEIVFGRDMPISEIEDDDPDYQEEPYMIIQNPAQRYVVSSKSRTYYEKNRWYINTESSFAKLCWTLIFPKEFIGDIVGLINLDKW